MDDCMLADLANFDDVLAGQDGNFADDDVTNLNSSLLEDVFTGGDFEGDLDSLLSSLTSPSSSSHSDSSLSPAGGAHFDQDEDFRMTDILGYVLDDDHPPTAHSLSHNDHDYSRPDAGHHQEDQAVHQHEEEAVQDVPFEEEPITDEEQTNEEIVSFEDEEHHKVEEIVVQTVQIAPQQQRTLAPRKYITILPAATTAQSKTQVKLLGCSPQQEGDSSSESSSNSSPVAPKRRRLLQGSRQLKAYPALILTPEEKELCQKDGIVLPEYYPLTKSEESDLRKIRRKIRNKISAQKSRGRKKEYVDDMEARAKLSETQNKQLKKKVAVLEAQNKTLIGQLQKMKSLLASSSGKPGLGGGQKSATALMVLLLSTALFAVPGFKEQYGGKTDLGTAQPVSSPPIGITPRASRSLLHYIGNGELGGSYPNIRSTNPRSILKDSNAQTYQYEFDNKEKTKLDLMESLNFSKELLENIRRQQGGSAEGQISNKTKIVTTAEVKSYSNM